MSFVGGNPINSTDPTGNSPCVYFNQWNEGGVKTRVDEAERYISLDRRCYSSTIDTYTAAGIAIQCAGRDEPNDNSGRGAAQISNNQAKETYGISIGPERENRGYGLRCFIPIGARDDGTCSLCKTPDEIKKMPEKDRIFFNEYYKLESVHDQTSREWAVIYMRRRIQMVINACRGCTPTDIFIAAALSQNGPGFTKFDLDDWLILDRNRVNEGGVTLNWRSKFADHHDNADDTSLQLSRFILVTDELKRRSWFIPEVVRETINELSQIGD